MIIRQTITGFILISSILVAAISYAKGIYQQPDAFVSEAFNQQIPEPDIVWVKDNLREQIENILQHKYDAKRVRYWIQDHRSVWILEEVGKKQPITVGITIDDNKISQLKVLIFRETRGWEVRYPFFSNQFNQLSLADENKLNGTIDGISGATLSVRALTKLARIALLLNQHIHTMVSKQ